HRTGPAAPCWLRPPRARADSPASGTASGCRTRRLAMSRQKMLVGAALAAVISGAIVSATPGSGSQSTLLGRSRYEAFDVTRRVTAPKDHDSNRASDQGEEDGHRGRTTWQGK